MTSAKFWEEEEAVEEDLKAAEADATSSNDTYPEEDYLEAELITDDDPDVNEGETPVQSSEKLTLEDADEASKRQNWRVKNQAFLHTLQESLFSYFARILSMPK